MVRGARCTGPETCHGEQIYCSIGNRGPYYITFVFSVSAPLLDFIVGPPL